MHKEINDYEINKLFTTHRTGNMLLSSVENSIQVTMTDMSVILCEFKYKMTKPHCIDVVRNRAMS